MPTKEGRDQLSIRVDMSMSEDIKETSRRLKANGKKHSISDVGEQLLKIGTAFVEYGEFGDEIYDIKNPDALFASYPKGELLDRPLEEFRDLDGFTLADLGPMLEKIVEKKLDGLLKDKNIDQEYLDDLFRKEKDPNENVG